MTTYQTWSGEGNCGPTAMLNLIKYYAFCRNMIKLINVNLSYTYNSLVSACNYNPATGGLTATDAKNGLKSYVQSRGYSFSATDYWWDTFNWFKDDINNNWTVYVSVRGYDYQPKEVGHAVVAIGYIEYSNGSRYLRVMDGWRNNTDRYVIFDDHFVSVKGIVIKIKP